MRIAIAADHAGFTLKEQLKAHLVSKGHAVEDCGVFSEERSDYPDFGREAALRVADHRADRGVLVCGSGIGMCMVANRVGGVRAVVLRDRFDAEMSRRHNDANLACLGARRGDMEETARLLDLFLSTPFDGGRHDERVAKLTKGRWG